MLCRTSDEGSGDRFGGSTSGSQSRRRCCPDNACESTPGRSSRSFCEPNLGGMPGVLDRRLRTRFPSAPFVYRTVLACAVAGRLSSEMRQLRVEHFAKYVLGGPRPL